MNLHDYQGAIEAFARYPHVHSKRYTAMGLFGEVGEIANKVKKIWRDDDGILSAERATALRDELGDVLWYAVRFAHHQELIVGTFTIELGAANHIFGKAYPVTDVFTAVERLSVLSGIVVAAAISPNLVTPEDLLEIVQALLNSIADLADQLDTDLEEVAQMNVDKLTGRLERNTIGGAGDVR